MGETINLEVTLRAFVRRETKRRWTAICPSLGVASQGESADNAKASLREAVELWFESCVERGVLDQAMRESNFRALPSGEMPPRDSEHVLVNSSLGDEEADIRGDLFPIQIEIPAYQAAALLSVRA